MVALLGDETSAWFGSRVRRGETTRDDTIRYDRVRDDRIRDDTTRHLDVAESAAFTRTTQYSVYSLPVPSRAVLPTRAVEEMSNAPKPRGSRPHV